MKNGGVPCFIQCNPSLPISLLNPVGYQVNGYQPGGRGVAFHGIKFTQMSLLKNIVLAFQPSL